MTKFSLGMPNARYGSSVALKWKPGALTWAPAWRNRQRATSVHHDRCATTKVDHFERSVFPSRQRRIGVVDDHSVFLGSYRRGTFALYRLHRFRVFHLPHRLFVNETPNKSFELAFESRFPINQFRTLFDEITHKTCVGSLFPFEIATWHPSSLVAKRLYLACFSIPPQCIDSATDITDQAIDLECLSTTVLTIFHTFSW